MKIQREAKKKTHSGAQFLAMFYYKTGGKKAKDVIYVDYGSV